MIQSKYMVGIKQMIKQYMPDAQAFIYGSALYKKDFRDIDIGFSKIPNKQEFIRLEEAFEESTFPYIVDLVDFAHVSETFKDEVFKHKVLWLHDIK